MRATPKFRWLFGALGMSTLLMGASCDPGEDEVDKDGDGFLVSENDCNDFDPLVNPGAVDVCDGQDNNCDLRVDEADDFDQDGASNCNGGDCDDFNPAVEPGAPEIVDNLDNDCNCDRVNGDTNGDGLICGPGDDGVDDDPRGEDIDGDGFCEGVGNPLECQDGSQPGDCNELNNLVSPGSIEVVDEFDNNCDGQVDELPVPCDGGLNANDPFSFAKAMGLGCAGEVQSALFVGPMANANTSGSDGTPFGASRAIMNSYGALDFPFEGSSFMVLSSGEAASTADHESSPTQFGSDFLGPNTSQPHPDPKPEPNDGCGESDFENSPTNTIIRPVNDYTEYRLTVRVPPNANGFSYRLQFLSAEYPVFHCDSFDDTFLALLSSSQFTGNISFDALGKVISVNTGFFQICNVNDQGNVCLPGGTASIAGTGYQDNGATQALVTTVPTVVPGELIELRFIIFDEGDHTLDSSVVLDAWQWIGVPCEDDPNTPQNECDPSTKIP
jgi:hypothetical protein